MLNTGDVVRIRGNGYDDFVSKPPGEGFEGELATIESIEPNDANLPLFQVRLHDVKKHEFLSGGDGTTTWPFFETELELADGA